LSDNPGHITSGHLDLVKDVLGTGHVDVTYAYPVYTYERLAIMRRIRDFLELTGHPHVRSIRRVGVRQLEPVHQAWDGTGRGIAAPRDLEADK